ncbi:MAG: sulfurtransferase [Streptosporangiales bacterium]|nr:sulfurtransferase [Streptosporangiales bacterium]
MSTHTSGQQLHALLHDDGEVAVVDLRSPLRHENGHIAAASNIPYQVLEHRIVAAVPRRDTPVVLAGEPRLDDKGARMLERLGYRDVHLLDGGLEGWRRFGGRIYTGTNVRSKALGEWVEHRFATPTVDAETLRKWQETGEDVVVVDSRTTQEYLHHHIPDGLHSGGGAELVYRIAEAVRDSDTRVVVNCQGRTRGIVGAQSLINTGLPNAVFSLRNGTPAWEQAGFTLATGEGERIGVPAELPPATVAWAERALAGLGVETLEPSRLHALLRDPATTYLLDVRTAEEYAAGHLPGSVSTPGGQLVQAADEHIVVRNSHVVLVDSPDRIRAANTAHWLRYLHRGPLSVVTSDIGVSPGDWGFTEASPPAVERVAWPELAEWLADGSDLRVFDLRHSDAYRAGHIEGSVHARRETLDRLVAEDDTGTIVLVGDATFAPEYVAADLSRGGANVRVLDGGVAAVEDELTRHVPVFAGDIEDTVGPPDVGPEREAWYRDYFAWELSLLEQTAGDPLFDFDGASP